MNIRNDNISFGENIKFIKQSEFKQKVKSLNKKKHYVGLPWTADSLKEGKIIYTDTNTACIIVAIKDGSKYKLSHLCTYKSTDKLSKKRLQRFDFEDAKRRIIDGLNLENNNLHAYIFGGFPFNKKVVNKIKKFFEDLKIPFTELTIRKDTYHVGIYSYLLNNKEDTIYITNSSTGAYAFQWDENLSRPNEVNLIKDKIVYNTYEKKEEGYNFKRQIGSIKDYFESQFENVKLSKFDKFN